MPANSLIEKHESGYKTSILASFPLHLYLLIRLLRTNQMTLRPKKILTVDLLVAVHLFAAALVLRLFLRPPPSKEALQA